MNRLLCGHVIDSLDRQKESKGSGTSETSDSYFPQHARMVPVVQGKHKAKMNKKQYQINQIRRIPRVGDEVNQRGIFSTIDDFIKLVVIVKRSECS